ncbi:T9SS type A sorting domain-containing protein [bacterium SCSIO 12643]|nr:T9SS type A sorting domain-containing protein [bacterium SCSIO 12643]
MKTLKKISLGILGILTIGISVQAQNPCANIPAISANVEKATKVQGLEGSDIILNAPSSGTSYQWVLYNSSSKTYSNIPGATNATFVLNSITPNDAGLYNCQVDGVMEAIDVQISIFANNALDRKKDSLALVDFFNSSNGPLTMGSWNDKTNWLTSAPIDTWKGITVQGCRVTEIRLSQNNIIGTIPTSFKDLTELRLLDIWDNQLGGTIDISTMPNLTWVSVAKNNLTDITTNTSDNFYDALVHLNISNNNMTNKTLNIKGMPALNRLHFEYTGISTFELHNENKPGNSAYYSNLKYLILNSNNVSGPLDVSAMPILESVTAHYNQISDFITSSIGHPNLHYVLISNNLFNNKPLDLTRLPVINNIQAENAQINDLMIGLTNQVSRISLSGNNLTSFNSVIVAPTIVHLDLGNNNLNQFTVGPVNYPNLDYLRLQNSNGLNGTLDLSNMPNLKYFNANSCNYSSVDFGNTSTPQTTIETIYLGSNSITSFNVKNMPTLSYVYLVSNGLEHFEYDDPNSTYPSNFAFNLVNNKLDFLDIAPYSSYSLNGLSHSYFNQTKVNPIQKGLDTIEVNHAGIPSTTSYQWFIRSGGSATPIPYCNTRVCVLNNPGGVSNTYYCRITNSNATALTIFSNDISLNASPIAPNNGNGLNQASSLNQNVVSSTDLVYPNPIKKGQTFSVKNVAISNNTSIKVLFHSMNGKSSVLNSSEIKINGDHIEIPASVKKSGAYIVELIIDGNSSRYRVIVE